MKTLKIGLLVLSALLIVILWITVSEERLQDSQSILPRKLEIETSSLASSSPITPIPSSTTTNQQKALLGKKLFFESRLSRDNSINCASCHALSSGGVDGKRYSTGVNRKVGVVNAPSVFNAALNFRQFWNGRAMTLEEQVELMVTQPLEMNSDWPITIAKLKTDAGYSKEFAEIYADGITRTNVANAIAEFEHTLLTPNSRFDHFLRGDENAISAQEKLGFEAFNRYGCVSCHQGVLLGGNMFSRMGSVRDYFASRGNIKTADLGLYNITHKEGHRYYFKVASLRNVERTAPYFHDGSATTLDDAVRIMAYYNLGISMPKDDVENIVAFLKTLTGEFQGKPL